MAAICAHFTTGLSHLCATPLASRLASLQADYTLAFFPPRLAESSSNGLAAEKAAELEGRIGYLHFDAKFRIESVEEALGVEKETAEALDEERALTKSTDTYKRGDLYKMHTYNDAIRRMHLYVCIGQDGARDPATRR